MYPYREHVGFVKNMKPSNLTGVQTDPDTAGVETNQVPLSDTSLPLHWGPQVHTEY